MRTLIILFCAALLIYPAYTASGNSPLDELEYVALSEKEAVSRWENIKLSPIELTAIPEKSIVSFDVADHGKIAVALDDCYLLLYNADYVLEKAYHFHVNGNYYVVWVDDHLALITVRGDLVIEFTEDGFYINVRHMDVQSQINADFRESLMDRTSLMVDGYEFSLTKKDGLAGMVQGYYRSLIVTDQSGTETQIYGVDSSVVTKSELFPYIVFGMFGFILAVLLVAGVLVPIIIRRKLRNNRRS